MTSLWQAIAIIMAVSFISLGVRPGAVVALSIPLTLAIVFPIMEHVGIDLQRISLGALIIALSLLVDDAMTTVDAMTHAASRQGDSKEKAATFAYKTLAFPMLTGSSSPSRASCRSASREVRPANTPSRSSPSSASR